MKHIIIETTSRCNLSCSMCLRHSWTDFRTKVVEFPFSPCGDCGLADGCGYIAPDRDFLCDCSMCEQPCGDCMWSRGILQCP
ncbi:MAG: hypothetical protein AB1640_15675 [bacterium]